MESFLDGLKKFGPQRLAAMAAVTVLLLGFFGFIILRVSQPSMTTLFTDLSNNDTIAITKELDAKAVKYELRQDGAIIMVPTDQVLRLRMDLAGKGLPSGGGMGYEIFDKSDNFSATSFVQNVNHLRALEGELARTIRSLDRVQNVRVHLVLPERKLFSREQQEPRAAIVVKVRGELDAGQVRAIRHLTASAVEGLKAEHVSIVDESGRLLADGSGNETDIAALSAEKQVTFERRLKDQVEDIVAKVVGFGRSRVQVAADLDFNRIQQTSETFDPESRVVRSTQTKTEAQVTSERNDGTVSVANELPAAQANNQNQQPTRDNSQKNEETVNYEISRTTRTEINEGGRIKKLSVAVLVDGSYAKGPNGDLVYQPRSAEDLERIQVLVRSAMGFDKGRGDQLEVVNLRFAEAPPVEIGRELGLMERLFAFSKDDILRMIELAVFAVLTLLVLLLVIRPLLRQVFDPMGSTSKGRAGSARAGGEAAALANQAAVGPGGIPNVKDMVEFANLNGALRASTIDEVGKIVEARPQESIGVLRNWIHGAP